MAKRKRKKSTARRSPSKKGLSAPHRRRRRKKGLSDGTAMTMAANAFKRTLLSTGGGLGAVAINKVVLPATSGKPMRLGVGIIGGFIMEYFGMPIMGASFSGGMTALAFKDGMLNDDLDEDNEFADEDSLSDAPLFLDEEGEPLVLEEGDGEAYYRYLTDHEKSLIQQ